MAAPRFLCVLVGFMVLLALALESTACTSVCDNACRNSRCRKSAPGSCWRQNSWVSSTTTARECSRRANGSTQCVTVTRSRCSCTCSGCCTQTSFWNISKRKRRDGDLLDTSHPAIELTRSTEGDPSPTPTVYQAQGEPIGEEWLRTFIHPNASLVENDRLSCSLFYCDSDCGFYNFIDLGHCGHPNATILWDLAEDNQLALIRSEGTELFPALSCTGLVHMPASMTKSDLFDLNNPLFFLSQADQLAEANTGTVIRNMTININLLGITNAQAFAALAGSCSANIGEQLTSFSLLDGSDVVRRASRRTASAEPAYTFTFQSILTPAQLQLASESLSIGLSSFAPASAGAAGGVAAGTVVGAVIGSVVGAVLVIGVAGGAVVAGRAWIVRRRQRTVQEAHPAVTEDSMKEEDIEMEEPSSVKPSKFSVQVMGNTSVAGSLTMRNPQLQD